MEISVLVDNQNRVAARKHWQPDWGCFYPDSKVHGANMGPIWGRQDPGGHHVGPMDFAIWVVTTPADGMRDIWDIMNHWPPYESWYEGDLRHDEPLATIWELVWGRFETWWTIGHHMRAGMREIWDMMNHWPPYESWYEGDLRHDEPLATIRELVWGRFETQWAIGHHMRAGMREVWDMMNHWPPYESWYEGGLRHDEPLATIWELVWGRFETWWTIGHHMRAGMREVWDMMNHWPPYESWYEGDLRHDEPLATIWELVWGRFETQWAIGHHMRAGMREVWDMMNHWPPYESWYEGGLRHDEPLATIWELVWGRFETWWTIGHHMRAGMREIWDTMSHWPPYESWYEGGLRHDEPLATIWELVSLHQRHNDHDGVSNHQPHHCLLNRLFRRRSKKTSKLRVTGLCAGNSSGPVNSPHKWPVTRKMFPFDDVIMWGRFET